MMIMMTTVTVMSVHAKKAYRWSRSSAPVILNLGTIWGCLVSFTLLPPCARGQNPRGQLNWRLGGSPDPSGRLVRTNNNNNNNCPYPSGEFHMQCPCSFCHDSYACNSPRSFCHDSYACNSPQSVCMFDHISLQHNPFATHVDEVQ